MAGREGERERVCPRCGGRYSYLERRRVNEQVYVYAVHERWVGGKRERKRCYLGPEGHYIMVNVTHEGQLALTGLPARDAVDYLENLLAYFAHGRARREEVERALEVLREWLPEIERRALALKSAEEEEQ